MAKIEQIRLSGGDAPSDKSFSDTVAHERHHRTAMNSLHDLVVFHRALKKEMLYMEEAVARGLSYDRDLYKKMAQADDKYKDVMQGFMHLSDDEQRRVMIIFADAVKDLIAHIHHKRKH